MSEHHAPDHNDGVKVGLRMRSVGVVPNGDSSFLSFASLKIKKVQVGKDQEKAQSEKDSHSKNQGGKKTN